MSRPRLAIASLVAAAALSGWARPAIADPPVRMAPMDHVVHPHVMAASPAMLPTMMVTLQAARPVSGGSVSMPDANLVVPVSASGPTAATHGLEAMSAAEMIQKIGTLQFLSATIIPARKEVLPVGDHSAITQITPSLRIAPTFVGKTYGLTAIATF